MTAQIRARTVPIDKGWAIELTFPEGAIMRQSRPWTSDALARRVSKGLLDELETACKSTAEILERLEARPGWARRPAYAPIQERS